MVTVTARCFERLNEFRTLKNDDHIVLRVFRVVSGFSAHLEAFRMTSKGTKKLILGVGCHCAEHTTLILARKACQ
eukprot:6208896-Pleurochrysis_carterae.AAC.1